MKNLCFFMYWILLLSISGCGSGYVESAYQSAPTTNTESQPQKYYGCYGLMNLRQEIQELAIQYHHAENRVFEMESQSNLLTNPLGWTNAILNQEEVLAARDGLARQLQAKIELYKILLVTEGQNCQ